MERLVHERSIALGHALGRSTRGAYSSHLNSYLNFCKMHQLPVEPTEDTMSFYIVYMCAHIEPRSVNSYLSRICSGLEVYYPNVRQVRSSQLVHRTLRGSMRLRSNPIQRKRALNPDDLQLIADRLATSTHYDDMLFLCQLVTSFHSLMRLGELVWPDHIALRDYRKLCMRHLVIMGDDEASFLLPAHKADAFFEGSRVLLVRTSQGPDPVAMFTLYLRRHDHLFPMRPELWIKEDGSVPARAWFIAHLRQFFPRDVAGHSLWSGGATAAAARGMPPHLIQALGRWSSDSWQAYIRKHPVLLHALLFSMRG